MNPSIRCLDIQTVRKSSSEMEKVGVDPVGIQIMEQKLVHLNLKISGLTPAQANIIKQELLSVGGEAAVSGGVVSCEVDATDAILSGTYKQLNRVIKKLKVQPYGLADLGDALTNAIFNSLQKEIVLEGRSERWVLGNRTLIMGVLNVTPDSFFDGGRYLERDAAIERAVNMVEEGADIIDIGGESTRPGSKSVSLKEELERVIPVVEELVRRGIKVSLDTTKAEVARQALDIGVEIINDVSALSFDKEMVSVCAKYRPAVILMHMRGKPFNMQDDITYSDLLAEVFDYLKKRIEFVVNSGIQLSRIAIDPGIGFGKSEKDNLKLLKNICEFKTLGRPIVIGTSRKSFIGKTLDLGVDERLEGTAATVAVGILKGANIVRVHDVGEIRRVVDMTDAIKES
ncbi:MAG: dihydropteroate synthase [Thermodesulfobacteriota bacterium]